MSQSKAAIVTARLILGIWHSQFVTVTSRHHLTGELRWRTIGRVDAGQSQTEVARWLNLSPSVLVHSLSQQFLTTGSASRRFSQGRPYATTSANDRYLSLCARRNRTATPSEIRSSLTESSGRLLSGSWKRISCGTKVAREIFL